MQCFASLFTGRYSIWLCTTEGTIGKLHWSIDVNRSSQLSHEYWTPRYTGSRYTMHTYMQRHAPIVPIFYEHCIHIRFFRRKFRDGYAETEACCLPATILRSDISCSRLHSTKPLAFTRRDHAHRCYLIECKGIHAFVNAFVLKKAHVFTSVFALVCVVFIYVDWCIRRTPTNGEYLCTILTFLCVLTTLNSKQEGSKMGTRTVFIESPGL